MKFRKSFYEISLSFFAWQTCMPLIYRLPLYWKGNVWQKHIELTFNYSGDYYYPKDNIYIWMSMPRCQCRDFQMVILRIYKDKYFKDKLLSRKWTNSTKETNNFTYCNYAIAVWYHTCFYKQHFYKQIQTEFGRKSSKCLATPWLDLRYLMKTVYLLDPSYHPKIIGHILKINKRTSVSVFMRSYD